MERSSQKSADLLALLQSADFRANFSALAPDLAHVPAAELLLRWRTEMAVTEISHGFHAANIASQNNALDFDIDMALDATWFYNQWQMPLLYPAREEAAFYELVARPPAPPRAAPCLARRWAA